MRILYPAHDRGSNNQSKNFSYYSFKKILAQFDTYFERELYHGSLLVLYILNAARQVSYTFSST